MPFPPLPKEDLQHVLEHTRSLWEQMDGGRIFVTGATGFFGIWLLETFAHANKELGLHAELVGISRNPEAFYDKAPHLREMSSIRLIQGDVRNFKFPEGPFTHVIHAGATPGDSISPIETFQTIVQGTSRTIDFATSAGAKRYLFVSSGGVYGKQRSGISHIPETCNGAPDPMDPKSAYAEGKRAGELLCAIAHTCSGLETMIARCFAFVGPHLPLDAHFAIGNFIRDALNGNPIKLKDGTPTRSYLYASDLAICLWTILFKGKPCHPYNVGSDRGITIAELARTVASTLGGSLDASATKQNQELAASCYLPSTERIMSELALAQTVGIEEAILKTAKYHESR